MKNRCKIYLLFLFSMVVFACQKGQDPGQEQLDRYSSAKALYYEGQWEESLLILNLLYEENPDFAEAAHLYGTVLFNTGKGEQAMRIWEGILEEDLHYIDTVKSLSRLYIESGRYNEARRILEGGLSYSAADPTLLFLLADLESEERNYDAALSLLSTAESHMERQLEIPLKAASLYQMYGFYDVAIEKIEKSIALSEQDNPLRPALLQLKETLEKEREMQ